MLRFASAGTRRFARPPGILVIGIALIVIAIIAGAVAIAVPGASQKTGTAYFQKAIGIYKDSDVDVLGVKVGSVTSAVPQGNIVKVTFTYSSKYKIPAGADAVLVSPSLVADRYLQLTPVYRGGPVMADGTTIPQSRTAVPVEPDQGTTAMSNLAKALGPNGANKKGALNQLIKTGAANLQGQGYNFHQTLQNASAAAAALADNSGNFAETITNLNQFTSSLAANDQQVSAVTSDMNNVSEQLNGERTDLSAALAALGNSLNQVAGFVRQNRQGLTSNVAKLGQVTNLLVKEKQSVENYLWETPLGAENSNQAYDPLSGSLVGRVDPQQTEDLSMFLCSLLYSEGESPNQCGPLLKPLNVLGQAITPFLKSDSSPMTEMTTHYNVIQPPPDAYGSGNSSGSSSSGSNQPASDGTTNPSLVP